MTSDLAKPDDGAALLEKVVIQGDLSKLSAAERLLYYRDLCDSLGLNPLTRPFDYLILDGKLTLYAKRDAADQLRKKHGVSITKVEPVLGGDLYTVTAYAQDRTGKTDSDIGAVSIVGLKGIGLANAMMKAVTKAKRRVTLSIVGLGMLDETEAETVPGARFIKVDSATGEILDRVGGGAEASARPLDPPEGTNPPSPAPSSVGGFVGADEWKQTKTIAPPPTTSSREGQHSTLPAPDPVGRLPGGVSAAPPQTVSTLNAMAWGILEKNRNALFIPLPHAVEAAKILFGKPYNARLTPEQLQSLDRTFALYAGKEKVGTTTFESLNRAAEFVKLELDAPHILEQEEHDNP